MAGWLIFGLLVALWAGVILYAGFQREIQQIISAIHHKRGLMALVSVLIVVILVILILGLWKRI